MNDQQTQPCPDCDGYGFTIDVEHDIFYGDGEPTLLKCLKCQGKGYIPGEPEPPEYDADKAEREENARLDAIEAERDLKAYRAEHGDDDPDPLEIEEAEMGDVDDYDQLRIERGQFETENYQLKKELAAVTAERDKYKAEYEELHASGLTMALPKSILRVVDEDQPEPEYPDLEPDFNKLERDETARLDAIEDEANLKAYRAEHGDDAPDPTPVTGRPLTETEENLLWVLRKNGGRLRLNGEVWAAHIIRSLRENGCIESVECHGIGQIYVLTDAGWERSYPLSGRIHLSNHAVASINESDRGWFVASSYEDGNLESFENAEALFKFLSSVTDDFVLIDTGDYITSNLPYEMQPAGCDNETYDPNYCFYIVATEGWQKIRTQVMTIDRAWREEKQRLADTPAAE